jgi:sugar phosphate isomerase/epimerase
MAAKELGCQQFRVNTYGDGSYLEQLNSSAKSLRVLADEAAELNIEVLVENHGHPSSNGAWLAMLIDSVERSNVGVYLDLDNFFMGGWEHCPKRYYDRRQGIEDLSPFTRAVSAKSYRFDDHGLETTVNYRQSFELLSKSGFSGVISAEYEGEFHSEMEGTEATLNLIRQSISHLADN